MNTPNKQMLFTAVTFLFFSFQKKKKKRSTFFFFCKVKEKVIMSFVENRNSLSAHHHIHIKT
jgi:hypothetical protein